MSFDDAVEDIVERDPRYHRDAYAFLRDALEFTMKRARKEDSEDRHVNGAELLAGFRDHALEEYGPIALAVLRDWGIRTGSDVGVMVFNLIEVGVFGRSDEDSLRDFDDVIDFEGALAEPFRPRRGMRPDEGGRHRQGRGGSASHKPPKESDTP